MKDKTKKIFKRVGAGLMLGLSLLGFGASARGGQTSQLPKKLKNFRQKGKEQLNIESQNLLTMIENEARTTIAEQQTEQQRQDLQQRRQQDNLNKLNLGQKIFRYGVLGVWTVAAGLFFSSLVFNAPVTLGKKVLSVLPGNPHTAALKMAVSEESKESDKMIINFLLDSDDYPVRFVKAIVKYDSQKLDFSGYRINREEYQEVRVNEVAADEKGLKGLEIFFQTEQAKVFENEIIGQIDFETIAGGEIAKVEFSQPESLVIADTEEGERNILGMVGGAKFLTKTPKVKIKVNCYAFGENPVDSSAWQNLIKGRLARGESGYWQDVDNESSFICGEKDGKIYFLLAQMESDNLKELNKVSVNMQKASGDGSEKTIGEKVVNWEENGITFSVFQFALAEKISDAKNFFAEFSGDNYIVKWPSAESFGRMEVSN